MIKRPAFAKINLFLDIEGIRADGYHNIVSVMQTVDWADEISIEKADGEGILLTCSDPLIPTDRKNTVYKAADLFLTRISASCGVQIHIEKNIPSAAGLAGGSADAAAALLGLNQLFDSPIPFEELLAMGARVGADVPFCMIGGTRRTTGIGEIIENFPTLPPCVIVCAKAGEGVSTPEAYRALDERYNRFAEYEGHVAKENALRAALENNTIESVFRGLYNVFEGVVEPTRPAVSAMKAELLSHGAIAAMMSGSGPSVFGIFLREDDAQSACEALRQFGAQCRVCRPCTMSQKGELI